MAGPDDPPRGSCERGELPAPPRGAQHLEADQPAKVGGAWLEVLRVGGLADGWAAVRLWLRWSTSEPIDWVVQLEGPGGEAADWASWYSDDRGGVCLTIPGAWRLRVLARQHAALASGTVIRWSAVRFESEQPLDLPAQAGCVQARHTVATGADTVIEPLRAQGFVSVQVLSGWPVGLLLVEGRSTSGATEGDQLDGAPGAGVAGGYRAASYGGPLALRSIGGAGPCTVQVVQR